MPTPLPVTVLLTKTTPVAAAVTTRPWLEVPAMRLPVIVFVGAPLSVMPSPSAASAQPLSRISLPVIVQPVAPASR